MRKMLILLVAIFLLSCNQPVEKTRGIPAEAKIKTEAPLSVDSVEQNLKDRGYQTFQYKAGDTTYLMQQYYMVFLKKGDNRSQDSTKTAKLQEQHLTFLGKMAEEGYASLIGPFGGDGDIRGIAVYNTATKEEADSLARLDPMVKAGRLKVEVYPWWTAKGGKLN